VLQRFDRTLGLVEDRATSAFGRLKTNLSVNTCCCSTTVADQLEHALPPDRLQGAASAEARCTLRSGTSSSGCQRRFARK